jgi:NADH-quinone oxidoreductase subunit N
MVLFSMTGGLLMVSFTNMVMLFLGIEVLSIPLFVLAGSHKTSMRSNEAAFKYFLLGAFASAFLLFGIALLYGSTGHFDNAGIATFLGANKLSGMALAGIIMMLGAMTFKVSAAPFHFWAPDVYTGSPTVITAFMATIVKTAAFAAFFRLFNTCFVGVEGIWVNILSIITLATLLLGNISAVMQVNAKRILAYSSISHAGYMLLAIVAIINGHSINNNALLFYTAAYSVASIISFTVFMNVSNSANSDSLNAFNGLGKRSPFMAFAMMVAILSLAGIPPMAGFFAKLFLFFLSIQGGHIWLVVGAVIASLVGIYYYLRFIIAMYGKDGSDLPSITIESSHRTLLIVALLALAVLSFAPSFLSIN